MVEMEPTDADLLQRIPREPAAFTIFYRRHVEEVLGHLRRRTGSAELAADIAAEAFAAVLAQAGRFDPTRGDGRGWLFGIVRHKLIDAQRSGSAERAVRRRLGIRNVPLTDDDVKLIDALGSEAEAFVAELPPDQRDAVRGRILEDLGYDELAERARVSPAAVRQRVSRGLAAIRTRMEQE